MKMTELSVILLHNLKTEQCSFNATNRLNFKLINEVQINSCSNMKVFTAVKYYSFLFQCKINFINHYCILLSIDVKFDTK